MRIAVLIVGLITGAIIFVQSLLVWTGEGLTGTETADQYGPAGILLALAFLIGVALVIPAPLVAMVIFLIGGLWGFGFSSGFPDLAYWGGLSLVLALFSFLGWRGKRRQQAKERLRDEAFQAMLAERERSSQV